MPVSQMDIRRYRELLCVAIRERRMVLVTYDDAPHARVFSPHILFATPDHGLAVAGVQLVNPDKPRDASGWRTFSLLGISRLLPSEDSFVPDPGYNPAARQYDGGIVCRI